MRSIKRDLLIDWLFSQGYELELFNMEFITLVNIHNVVFVFANDFSNCVPETVAIQNFFNCGLDYQGYIQSFTEDPYCW